MQNAKRILILAPHTDDGELGCGASLKKYSAEGKELHYVAFSTCAESLPQDLPSDTLEKECRAATRHLGVGQVQLHNFPVRRFSEHRQAILEILVKLSRELKPQAVFLPSRHDIHQDHAVIHAEGIRAFKHASLLGYELPWNQFQFTPTYFETLSEEYLKAKTGALQLYVSQQRRTYMSEEFQRSVALVRGLQCGARYAEAFELYRMVV